MKQTEQLKQGFEKLFPAYAARLKALCKHQEMKTQAEITETEEKIEAIQKELLDRIAADLRSFLEKNGEREKDLLRDEENEGMAIQLRPEKYEELIHAKGDEIETQILKLMDEMQRLKDLETGDAEAITAAILAGGLSAITAAGIVYLTWVYASAGGY